MIERYQTLRISLVDYCVHVVVLCLLEQLCLVVLLYTVEQMEAACPLK